MKFAIALVVAILVGSEVSSASGACVARGQFKGIELYSWEAESNWLFALVPGTNRLKSEREIKSTVACIHTLEQVQLILAQLGEKDEIFWIERQSMRFVLPSASIVAAVSASASSSGAKLRVVKQDRQ